jgi:hypothetical protein
LAVWLVADFEALSCQVTTTFDTSCAARIPTAPAINYTACWQLVFIHIRLFVIYLALFSCRFNLHQPIHEAQIYFVFLSVGQNGFAKVRCKGGSSFASLWFERWLVWACKCAYDCVLAMQLLFFQMFALNR